MTTDTKRLAERLRYTAQINLSRGLDEAHPWVGELNKAADALDAQATLLSEAAEVLRPFAARVTEVERFAPRAAATDIEMDDLRRARALLARIEAMK